jgi:hypothetical protein
LLEHSTKFQNLEVQARSLGWRATADEDEHCRFAVSAAVISYIIEVAI